MPTFWRDVAPSSLTCKDLPATQKLWNLEISQIVAVLSSQYGVMTPHDCYNTNGDENHFEVRNRISQSHQAAVKVITFHIDSLNCNRSVEVFPQSWSLYWGWSGNYCSIIFHVRTLSTWCGSLQFSDQFSNWFCQYFYNSTQIYRRD